MSAPPSSLRSGLRSPRLLNPLVGLLLGTALTLLTAERASAQPESGRTEPARPLERTELAANRAFRGGLRPGLERLGDVRAAGATGAAWIQLGDLVRGASLLADAAGAKDSDCLRQTRLAEAFGGPGCHEHPPGKLSPLDRPADTAAVILARRRNESPKQFFAAVVSGAMSALRPADSLRVETTGDRFRITGDSILEGLWYLEDRILITAHPLMGADAEREQNLPGVRAMAEYLSRARHHLCRARIQSHG